MNTPLRRVGLAMMVLILLLMANATYVQVIEAGSLRSDSRNQRTLLDEYSRQRGLILDASANTKLADIKPTNDRLKYLRTYPGGAAFAPVTGYSSVTYGSSGLEHSADSILNGSDDRLFVHRLSDMITGRDPSGGDVETTIDPKLQNAAYNAMKAKGYVGATVAIRPKTGEILAMVSSPSYDPSPLASHDLQTEQSAWKSLNADKANPSINRAISETYPPGSTFKLVVAAAALSNGDNEQTKVPPNPTITLPNTNTTMSNFDHETCPGDTMQAAIAYSCNTAFATLAGQVGADKLRAQAAKFGIGQTDLSIPMPVAQSSLGAMSDQAAVYQSGIGQRDVRLTPLQDAMVVAAIANGGELMKPQLIKKILAPDLSTIDDFTPDSMGEAVSPEVAGELKDMMLGSEQHTGGDGKSSLQIASKTGTAEHGSDTQAGTKSIAPHGWYVAFAPANDPQIAVCTLVEDGGGVGLNATGSKISASVARATINAALGGG